MRSKTIELIEVLESLVDVLHADDEEQWSSWMTQAKDWIEKSDYSGVEKVLMAYGGMGSFNDLVLGHKEVDGVLQQKKGRRELNEKLDKLRQKAWQLATEIRHEHERST